MIKVYSGFKGLGVLFLFVAGAILFLSIFFWGISEVIQFFYPLLVLVAYLTIVTFTFGFIPATLIKDLRPVLATYALWMSNALGVVVWILSFFYCIKVFGLLGILVAFLFQLLIPIALVAAVLKSSWHIAGHLILWSMFAYAMRLYSQWLPRLSTKFVKSGQIIDVEARRV